MTFDEPSRLRPSRKSDAVSEDEPARDPSQPTVMMARAVAIVTRRGACGRWVAETRLRRSAGQHGLDMEDVASTIVEIDADRKRRAHFAATAS